MASALSIAILSLRAERAAPQMRYAIAALACALTTIVALPLAAYLDLANIAMLFLLAVALIARGMGRAPAVLASFLSVALFDFFFVPPHYTFAVADAQYLFTFGVMLAVALIIGQLTAGLREQAKDALEKERRTHALYELAREVAGSLTTERVATALQDLVRSTVDGTACLLVPRSDGVLQAADGGAMPPWIEDTTARFAMSGDRVPGASARQAVAYLPALAGAEPRGVLAVAAANDDWTLLAEERDLLQALTSVAAIALERLHYVEVANVARVRATSENLRSSILSALSHDLRTPLTVLVGLADSLAVAKPAPPPQQRELAEAVREQAARLHGLVLNLLDMARLNAGEVKLRREWQPLEEVVGSTLKLLERSLVDHPVAVRLPDDLPLVEFDAVLIERVLCNLIENAAKYSPPGAPIDISAATAGDDVAVDVRDRGAGISENEPIFDTFARGSAVSRKPGLGLGLAICRAIVEAHGGSISAHNEPDGGARFGFTLPRGHAPAFDGEELPARAP